MQDSNNNKILSLKEKLLYDFIKFLLPLLFFSTLEASVLPSFSPTLLICGFGDMAIAAAAVVVPLGLLFLTSGLVVNLIQVLFVPIYFIWFFRNFDWVWYFYRFDLIELLRVSLLGFLCGTGVLVGLLFGY